MEERLVNLIFGTLLHDIGKIVYRTGVMEAHSSSGSSFISEIDDFRNNSDIMECIGYHHGRDLTGAKLRDDSLAYISYIADNISAAGDRRVNMTTEGDEIGGSLFDKSIPLSSVFNILHGRKESYTYKLKAINEINYPTKEKTSYSASEYSGILNKIKEQLNGVEVSKGYINSVLHLLEATTSFIPSSTNTKELTDISLFDHSKTTAAIASCIYYYVQNKDFSFLSRNEKDFMEENAYILYSMDISGIQSYIYTISGTDALKSLRTRSLYLELLLENIADDLLLLLGLSRCNLIYTGGGHAYFLLPNTDLVKEKLEGFEEQLKQWFLENYDISLFIASGYGICNSNELSRDIGRVYERVGESISMRKSKRYKAEDIIRLNSMKSQYEERECKECKKTGHVGEDGRCDVCQALVDISPDVIKDDIFFVVFDNRSNNYPKKTLPLPFGRVLALRTMNEIKEEEFIRVYSKNNPSMGHNFVTNLWMGDYSVKSNKGYGAKQFEELSEEAKGINRISVLRADVDNLGKAFTTGFKDHKNRETISRTATLSRQLSMFFKYHINQILSEKNRNAIIIYSGGDDMFIVGGWNDIIDISKDIREAFHRYTQGALTISAGIGIYPHYYPISRIASEVGELENEAKTKDENKNKVTLFRGKKSYGKEKIEDWVLDWTDLPRIEKNATTISGGIEKKLNEIRTAFKSDEEGGKAFLYKVLDLLRNSNDRINIARYAYLLKRVESKNKNLDVAKFYEYIKDKKERKELEIAITIYAYETR